MDLLSRKGQKDCINYGTWGRRRKDWGGIKGCLWLCGGGGLVHNEAIGSCIPLWRGVGRCGRVLPIPFTCPYFNP